jgi:hypothetical protein
MLNGEALAYLPKEGIKNVEALRCVAANVVQGEAIGDDDHKRELTPIVEMKTGSVWKHSLGNS